MDRMTQLRNKDAGERPLTARSIVASALLGTHPPVLRGQLLVRLGALFGVAEGTTRVALSRMVAAGELTAIDGRYELASPALLARQAAQERGRRTPRSKWAGEWALAIVTVERRDAPDRLALREAAGALRLAELREGVWTRPANLDWEDAASALDVVHAQCTSMRATPDDPDGLAAALWDLDGWATRASALVDRMHRSRASLDGGRFDAIPEGFVTSAAVLRLLRADPLLPSQLLPDQWPGDALREVYLDYDAALRSLLRAFFTPTPDRPSSRGAPARSRARRAPRAGTG
jgi:phenylacetic acid degradation operon negative regulatory protein